MRDLIQRLVLKEGNYRDWRFKDSAKDQDKLKLALEAWHNKEAAAQHAGSLALSLETDEAGDNDDKFYKSSKKFGSTVRGMDKKARSWQTSLNMWMDGKDPYTDKIKTGFQATRKSAMALLKAMTPLVAKAQSLGNYEVKLAKESLTALVKSIDAALKVL